jgi:hypothetical protein
VRFERVPYGIEGEVIHVHLTPADLEQLGRKKVVEREVGKTEVIVSLEPDLRQEDRTDDARYEIRAAREEPFDPTDPIC